MPRGDRTGPEGQGPRTGRQAGACTGVSNPGFMGRMFGRFGRGQGNGGGGGGRGRGRGQGMGRRLAEDAAVHSTSSQGQEVEFLKEEARLLRQELEEVKRRLAEVGGDNG